MGDFPVVMFDEDTTEPEKNKQIPSEKKNKKHIFTHLPIFAGFHGFTAAKCGAFVHLLTQTDL